MKDAPSYDEELLGASGSKEQYEINVKKLGERLRREVERLKTTSAGRKCLRKAGFLLQVDVNKR